MATPHHPSGPSGYDPGSRSAEVLRSLGLEALVEIIETIGYGVCVTGDEHTWTYLNPAGARMVGGPFEELEGRDYLLDFAEHERAALLALEHKQREGDTGFYANTLVRPDGSELQMTWSGTVVEVDGQELAPAIFHETTAIRRAQREASELGAGAVRLAEGRSTGDVLRALVDEAVAATRAAAALMLLEGPDGTLRVGASHGLPDTLPEAVRRSPARIDQLPAGELLLRGSGGFLSDDRDRLAANPHTRPWLAASEQIAWRGAAKLPIRQDDRVVGCLVVLVPDRLSAPSESEFLLWESLAEQASVALGTDRLRSEVSHASAALERERIARDLHDSVAQALFGLQARAAAIQRSLERDRPDLARRAAADLGELSRQATHEMRAMLGELRELSAGAEPDLYPALRALAGTLTRRDGLPVVLDLSSREAAGLPPATVEHLVRIAGEALHNAAKHADASRATLTVVLEPQDVVLRVTDDGRGFDTTVSPSLGHGQRTMRERAGLAGGTLSVVSRPGAGTTVEVRVPRPGQAPPPPS